jgi:hypothetical protein
MGLIMGKPICAVPLPPELQRDLPAGTLLFGFDGEVVFRSKNPNLIHEPRTYSLMPVTDNEMMYERRWNGQAIQDTYLSIEHFHGHAVTMFFFYFPIPKSTASELSEKFLPMVKEAAKGSSVTQELYSAAEKILPGKDSEDGPMYRPAAFAAMSWSTHQWLWITNTRALGTVMEGPMPISKLGKEVLKGMAMSTFIPVVGGHLFRKNAVEKRQAETDGYAVVVDKIVAYLRSEMNRKLQQNNEAGGRL